MMTFVLEVKFEISGRSEDIGASLYRLGNKLVMKSCGTNKMCTISR